MDTIAGEKANSPKMLCNERLKGFPWLTLQCRFGRLAVQAGCILGLPCRGQNMIKSELVMRLAERYPQLYHRDVERIVSTVLDEIASALASGDRVELRGFGAFSVKVRPARQGRNPRTGEAVAVGEKRVPFFRTGKELRERLNNGDNSE